MKKLTLFLILSMVIVFGAEAHKYKRAQVTISIQTFYDQLSPYGDWIYTHDYGYVWRPYFDNPASFRPYSSNGRWAYTDYGWTWVSGYDWGWATFHYGRWDFDNYLGWLWIPGYEWAPAWVSWGYYDNYYGWAPMGPNVYVQSNWFAPDPWWTFVPRNRFCSVNWNRYIYSRPVHVTHITHITNVYVNSNNNNNHNSWYYGPQVNEVERYNRGRVKRMEVVESQRPERTSVQNSRLNVYRPTVDNSRNDVRPAEYRNAEQARTGRKIEQTNARANDPGMNRTRESMQTETRSNTPMTNDRNSNSGRDNRTDVRPPVQNPGTRSTEATTRESRETPRNTTQPDNRNGSGSRETRIEPGSPSQSPATRSTEAPGQSRETPRATPQTNDRNGSGRESGIDQRNRNQGYEQSNPGRQSGELKREPANRDANIRVNEGNRTSPNPSRIENPESRQMRQGIPARENGDFNSSRGVNRETPSAQPTREPRTHDASPAPDRRNENTQSQQRSREQVQESDRKSANENPGERSSGTRNRR